MKKVYILNGAATSGKNTFVDMCNEYIKTSHYSYVEYARTKIAPLCGYQGGKSNKERDFLSDLNDLLIKYYDLPFKDITIMVDNFYSEYTPSGVDSALFIDIREPDAIDRACKTFDAKSILIKNDRVSPVESNHADANVENYNYDYIIENSGNIQDLRDSVVTFLKEETLFDYS